MSCGQSSHLFLRQQHEQSGATARIETERSHHVIIGVIIATPDTLLDTA